VQGVTKPDIIGSAPNRVYDQKYIENGASAVDNTRTSRWRSCLRRDDVQQGPSRHVKYTGKDKIAGSGLRVGRRHRVPGRRLLQSSV